MDASNESPDVQDKIYAAFILDREHINAKPLFAALLKLDKADGVAYKKIETTVQLSGYSFRTNIVLEENDTLTLQRWPPCSCVLTIASSALKRSSRRPWPSLSPA